MVTQLKALSISRSVQTGPIFEIGPVWRVLAVFERACNLATPEGEVVALVLPEISDGPLNIVVERLDQSLRLVQSGMAISLQNAHLRIGDLEIRLDRAAVWEPRPDWALLRRNRAQIESRLLLVRDLARRHAPPDSLLGLLSPESDLAGFGKPVRSDMVAQMAGLGSGLTPAGDDFLMGMMLQSWLAHPEPEPFCHQLVKVAASRTTTLSAALLRAAARGECSAPWHDLLGALENGEPERLKPAVQSVLAYGHTSGADTLAGFLWTADPIQAPGNQEVSKQRHSPS